MERAINRNLRYRQVLEAVHEVTPSGETALIELYLLFLQVAEEGLADRQVFFDRFVLSEGKFVVIWLLKTSGPLTPSQLAEEMGVTPGTITGLLAGLERSELISRQVHPTDGRKATIALTPAAFTLFHQMLSARFAHINAIISSFTTEEQQQLRTLLLKLHQQLIDDTSR